MKTAEEVSDILAQVYGNHVKSFLSLPSSNNPARANSSDVAPVPSSRNEANFPRSGDCKPLLPPTLPDVVDFVNDIWSALHILPSTVASKSDMLAPFTAPALPGVCPYPKLRDLGFIQPRPGAFLRSASPPQLVHSFASPEDFEQYIYSLAFHRDISPRTGKMLMWTLLSPQNVSYLTQTAFRYAIVALIERSSDLYSARKLAEYMSSLSIPLDVAIWNTFLQGAIKVESLRFFAIILRRMLASRRIRADDDTWNLILRMGLKINSTHWVSSVLHVMKARTIPLNHDSVQAVFMVLRENMDAGYLKTFYLQHFANEKDVPWKVLNVVLHALGRAGKVQEAWDLLVLLAGNTPPPEGTLHLFIRMCKWNNEYDRVWEIIGDFRRKWRLWPHSRGVAALFEFAFEREEFSDLILIWWFAKLRNERWNMNMKMKYRGRDVEREYGVPLDSGKVDGVTEKWVAATSGRRSKDPYYLVSKKLRGHVRMMKARRLSEQLAGQKDIPDDVKLWRKVEKTYDATIASGLFKLVPVARQVSPPHNQQGPVGAIRICSAIPTRIDSGWNLVVREKLRVFRMVRNHKLNLDI